MKDFEKYLITEIKDAETSVTRKEAYNDILSKLKQISPDDKDVYQKLKHIRTYIERYEKLYKSSVFDHIKYVLTGGSSYNDVLKLVKAMTDKQKMADTISGKTTVW